MDELILVESSTLRDKFCTEANVDLLDRVGHLVTLPGSALAIKKNVSDFFVVGESTVDMIISRHKEELIRDGYKVLMKKDLENFHTPVSFKIPNRGLAVFSRRAVLRIGMLLRNSIVAKLLRTYLLDVEQGHLPQEDSRTVLTEMAGQLTQHSIQISKNIEELKLHSQQLTQNADKLGELAQASIGQSRMIKAIVAEIYKNRDEIKDLRSVVNRYENRLDKIEKTLTVPEPAEYISQEQAKILQTKAKAKNIKTTAIWSKFKKHFGLSRYIHLPQERFEEALTWLDNMST